MGNPGFKPTTPKPPTEDKSINAKEIIVRNEHNNYPALLMLMPGMTISGNHLMAGSHILLFGQ